MIAFINNRINWIFLLLLIIAVLSAMKTADKKRVVIGYVTGYSGLINAEQIDAKQLTHINYAFVNVKNNQAHLDNEERDVENFKRLNALKAKNPS
ncbi:MAG: hypothetical protein EOO91_16415, partial [Pedobacter sp.]